MKSFVPRLTSVAFCLTQLFISNAVLAASVSNDIVGIRAGMNVQEVTSVIKQHSPKSQVQLDPPPVNPMKGVRYEDRLVACTTPINPTQCRETIIVKFTEMEGKAYWVRREVRETFNAQELKQSLKTKYGLTGDASADKHFEDNNFVTLAWLANDGSSITTSVVSLQGIVNGFQIVLENQDLIQKNAQQRVAYEKQLAVEKTKNTKTATPKM